jgi:HSP20 family protein
MSGMRSNWFMDVDNMLKETERLLGHLAGSKPPPSQFSRCPFVPPMDVYEREDKIVVVAELAGVSQDSIQVSVSGNLLTVRGERKDLGGGAPRVYYQMEICTGTFERTLALHASVDPDETEAYLSDGFLRIILTKRSANTDVRVGIMSS